MIGNMRGLLRLRATGVGLFSLVLVSCGGTLKPAPSHESDAGSSDAATQPQSVVTAKSEVARDTQPDISDADYMSVVAATNQYGFELFHKLTPDELGNVVYSPTSTVYALAMTYLGARGNTQTQMAATLHDAFPSGVFHKGLNRLSIDLASRNIAPHSTIYGQQSLNLSLVDAIWVQQNYALLSSYLDALAVNYDAGVKLLDFIGNPEGSRVTINQWVADQTANRILDLLTPGSISSTTRVVLTNALYFKASWSSPFKTTNTANESFNLLNGTTATVSAMHADGTYSYTEGSAYQLVDLPYDGNKLSMAILLPSQGQFAPIRDAISQDWLSQSLGAMASAKVNLALPKFSFTWGTKSLNQALQALGILDAFDASLADFSGIEAARQFFIGGVLHKAFIAIDESGTEAAAATAVTLNTAGIPTPSISFTVDRPFVFFIHDTSGAVLFTGQVLDPRQN
jgi:serpin B